LGFAVSTGQAIGHISGNAVKDTIIHPTTIGVPKYSELLPFFWTN
jgi:hypothetical protein